MFLFKNPHFLLLVTTFLWAGNAVAGKFAVNHISPMILTMGRWGIAFLIMLAIAHDKIKQDWPLLKKNWLYFLIMGSIGYTIFNSLLYSALQHITAINATLEQAAMPVIIFMLNFLLFKTKITWVQLLGYILTVAGVIITVSGGMPFSFLFSAGNTGLNIGDLFMLGAAFAYGGYSVGLRYKPAPMHWQSFLTGLIAAALLVSFLGAGFESITGQAQWPTSMQGFLVLFYTALFPSLLSQGFFIKGVEALGANIAGLYINTMPIFGALLSVFLLGETLHLFHAIAFILVGGGIYIAQRRNQ